MIRHLHHSEIDRQKWDNCIAKEGNGMLYGFSWYLDLVCPEWEALVNDDYTAVMPLTARKKYGFKYLFQPHFTQQLGVYAPSKAEVVQEFIQAIPHEFKFIEINLNCKNSFQGLGITVTENTNLELSLGKSYEEITGSYADNTKRNIKKAIESGITIKTSDIELEKVIGLFREDRGKGMPQLGEDYYQLLRQIIAACNQKASVSIYGAYADALCAAVVFISSPGRTIFLFSGNSIKGKSTGAMHYLVDRYIHDHAATENLLDFEGSNNPNLARFYKGFGAEESVYLRLRKNNLPWFIKWIKN